MVYDAVHLGVPWGLQGAGFSPLPPTQDCDIHSFTDSIVLEVDQEVRIKELYLPGDAFHPLGTLHIILYMMLCYTKL